LVDAAVLVPVGASGMGVAELSSWMAMMFGASWVETLRREIHMPSKIVRTGHAVISSEDVEGVSVYDANKKKIGKVDHLMIEKISGQITRVVISGLGFLGLGTTTSCHGAY
jgi:hypothetical protein